ncbi:kinetochore protein ndc80 [Anaeramoeba flamelloides]|uniref:Kinetochore protein NDC80 n=1 Tax=Anaeramoeba flamelloides TaxID=1746091 RepID=A0AAV7ZKU5_9EUKA|nr:kinetochore protein ndc80 [Anaeramoeba flamelloides]
MSIKKVTSLNNPQKISKPRLSEKTNIMKNRVANLNIGSVNRSKRQMSSKKSHRRSQELKRRRKLDGRRTPIPRLKNRRAITGPFQSTRSLTNSKKSKVGRSSFAFSSVQKNKKKNNYMLESLRGSEGDSFFTSKLKFKIGSSVKKKHRSIIGSGGRKSSYHKRGNVKRAYDPRPLDNKVFLQSARSKIIHYLNDHGFSKLESSKLLLKPDQKNFFKVTEYLFQIIDRNFSFSSNPSNEISAFFKKLRYPVPMSRSSLKIVSTQHSWRSLIGALYWLVELLIYSELCNKKAKLLLEFAMKRQQNIESFENVNLSMEELTLVGDDKSGESAFFDYLSTSYKCFLIGDDKEFEILEEELANCFAENNESLQSQTKQLIKENSIIINQIQELGSGISKIRSLKKKKNNLKTELESLLNEIGELSIEKNTLKNEIINIEGKENQIRTITHSLQKQKQTFKTIVENQKIHKKELKLIQVHKSSLIKTIKMIKKKKTEIDIQNWEQERNVIKILGQLKTSIKVVNNQNRELGLIGVNVINNFQNMDFQIAVTKHEQLSNNLPHVIQGLKKILFEFNIENKLIVKQIKKIKNNKLKIQDQLEYEKQELQNYQNTLNILKNNYKQSKNSFFHVRNDYLSKKEKENNILFNISLNYNCEINQIENIFEEINNQYILYQKQFTNEKRTWNKYIIDLLNVITNFKKKVEKKTQKLLQQSNNSVTSLQNI